MKYFRMHRLHEAAETDGYKDCEYWFSQDSRKGSREKIYPCAGNEVCRSQWKLLLGGPDAKIRWRFYALENSGNSCLAMGNQICPAYKMLGLISFKPQLTCDMKRLSENDSSFFELMIKAQYPNSIQTVPLHCHSEMAWRHRIINLSSYVFMYK